MQLTVLVLPNWLPVYMQVVGCGKGWWICVAQMRGHICKQHSTDGNVGRMRG